ncbi:protein POLR1D-like [Hypomesus transpacificus]|uniref:protein POLR1D-like n=1 Tax=Hypomesus transpacificus TaxID=137520 RepID=UPI001F07B07C|nr:protein POLR1D-like [Hypomesus transpacificus]
MAEDTELEKRAVEELLNEANRARVRAETMGPAGWMKCPLRSTNKRFLLNTLRNSCSQQRRHSSSPSREGQRSKSTAPRRTPPADPRADGDRVDRRNSSYQLKDREDKQKDCRYHHTEALPETHTKEPPSEGTSSQRSRHVSRDCSDSHGGVYSAHSNRSSRSGHASKGRRSRSPVRDSPRGRGHRF